MTRKTAIKVFCALLVSRAIADESTSLTDPSLPGVKGNDTAAGKELTPTEILVTAESALLKPTEEMTFSFDLKRITILIDGRRVTFTAKELADALEAK